MDDVFSLPVNPDSKHGLGLLSSDLETFQFPTLCEELNHEQLLALENSQSFYLTYPDAGVYRPDEQAPSRASTAITPRSECSTRTTVSARNISPTSDILSFFDKPSSKVIEAMYHDTTQSIISGRQSRAASSTWPVTANNQSGLNNALTPASGPIPHRPQSFSYRTPQLLQQEAGNTPPPPSSFFSSPNIAAQTLSRSPYLSPMVPQLTSPPDQTSFFPTGLTADPSSYYAQAQQAPQHQFHQGANSAYQHAFLLQPQTLSLHQPDLQRRASLNPNQQLMSSHLFPTKQQLSSPHISPASSTYHSSTPPATNTALPLSNNDNNNNTTVANNSALPNTTGNASAGYQCFSHGCGGRHFSNWGNLVRHHRERQLRSKAGAKPTCQRCGKGFTRSSARDAHVAGLKCVLGRRRRAAGGAGATKASLSADEAEKGQDGGVIDEDGEHDLEDGDGSDGSRDDAGEPEDDDRDDDGLSARRDSRSTREASVAVVTATMTTSHPDSAVDANFHLSSTVVDHKPSYLAPQQLQFEL